MPFAYRVADLPGPALEAARAFHSHHLAMIEADLAAQRDHLAIVFPPADHEHRGWRLAAVQQLARDHAPLRVNGIETADPDALAATLAYLDDAPGVTGHLLRLDATGAGALLSQDA